jgi:hypothetical protein
MDGRAEGVASADCDCDADGDSDADALGEGEGESDEVWLDEGGELGEEVGVGSTDGNS